jgi:phage baseplate assembly protein W
MANTNYVDFDLDLRKNPVSKDIVKLTNAESVKNSVKNILLTNLYEVPFHPEFGSGILSSLFDNWLPTSPAILEKQIAFILKTKEPRITLAGLEIYKDSNKSAIKLDVYFIIKATSETVILNLILARAR